MISQRAATMRVDGANFRGQKFGFTTSSLLNAGHLYTVIPGTEIPRCRARNRVYF